MRNILVMTLTLLAVAAINAAPKEVFLARHPRVPGGVQSYEQLHAHVYSPAGRHDVDLGFNKLRLTADQKAEAWRGIDRRFKLPLNAPGGIYKVAYLKGTEFAHITYGVGNEVNDLVKLGVDAVGYVINVSYPSMTPGRNLMTALVVFTACGNMSIGDAVEEQTPPPPAKPPEMPVIPPPVEKPPELREVPVIIPPVEKPPELREVPVIVVVPGPERLVPGPTVERIVERLVPAAPLLSLNRSPGGSGWAQNAPDNVVCWQKGSIGAGVTWQVGRQRMTTTTTPTPGQPCPPGAPPNNLPQPTPTPTPNPVGSVPANPGGVTDVGDGANGTTNVPPPTPIGTPNGSVQPVPAPGSAAGPPPNTTLRSYPSRRR